jgi:hypothetical protein
VRRGGINRGAVGSAKCEFCIHGFEQLRTVISDVAYGLVDGPNLQHVGSAWLEYSGPGIDPKNLERVFEAFYTTKSNGVGVGLAICRSLIEAHGGRLWAEANELLGAVFRFTLPNAENS